MKELFIRLTLPVFRERLSICVYTSSPFGFEGMNVKFDCISS